VVGDFQITNSLLTSWLAVLVIIVFSLILRLKLKKIPGKLQHVFEIVLDGALLLVDQVTNDRKISNKIFPVVFSVFIFILINNWLGILPFIGSMGFYMMEEGHSIFVPLFRGGTADINMTLTLGIVAVVGSNIFGIITLGIWKTINKYVKLQELGSIFTKVRKDPSVLVVAPISFFVGIIEFIGELAKIASLSFRLFGNIFAGEVLLSSMAAILAFVLPTPFLFLEVFIGLIQALIFSLLTTVYFTIAAQDHSEHEEHEHSHHKENEGELLHI
jgi:F-type H+-transporting ATPase subunit a